MPSRVAPSPTRGSGASSPITSNPNNRSASPSSNGRLFSPSTRSPTQYYTQEAGRKMKLCWVGCAGERQEMLDTLLEVLTYAISLLVAWEWNKCFTGWFDIWTGRDVESDDASDIPFLLAYALLVTVILLIMARLLKEKVEFAEDLV